MHRLLLTFCFLFVSVPSSLSDGLVTFQPCEQAGLQRKFSGEYLYKIVGNREKNAIELCPNAAARGCITLNLYKFDIECKGQRIAWSSVARRMAQGGIVKLSGKASHNLIFSSAGQKMFVDYGVFAQGRAKFRVQLPAGYAPLAELGARILPAPNADRPDFDLIQSAHASEGVAVQDAVALPPKVFSKLAQFASSTDVLATEVLKQNERNVSALEGAKASDVSQPRILPPATDIERANDARLTAASQAAAAAAWPTAVAQGVGIATSTQQNVQQSMIATILGLALITSLVSGIGWFATQRIKSLRARQADPYQLILRREFTDLERPDAQMCGELIRTSQQLVEEIQARTNEIKGAMPLRRVLLREVNSMEQFVITTLQTSPENPREWRRMRLRLQRVVTDLIRLKDIADVARRSLSTIPAMTEELPRDKQEAYEILGANPEASERILKRLVDALRATWHPDLATSEDDRAIRNLRIKQINVAWDLITEKRTD